jgi:hypothetical protein
MKRFLVVAILSVLAGGFVAVLLDRRSRVDEEYEEGHLWPPPSSNGQKAAQPEPDAGPSVEPQAPPARPARARRTRAAPPAAGSAAESPPAQAPRRRPRVRHEDGVQPA